MISSAMVSSITRRKSMGVVFNFLKISDQLENDPPESVDLKWLEESYRNPVKFAGDLFNYYAAQFPPLPKSHPFEHYDFYYDMVVRNLQKDRVALRWYEEELGWQNLTFPQLHLQVTELLQEWSEKGVKPGQTLCLVLPLGTRYLVALVAALRMGLVFSCLPPRGDRFLARRLKLLSPDHIVSDYIYTPLLSGFAKLLLDKIERKPADSFEVAGVYETGVPVARLFAPLSKDSDKPRDLFSDHAYSCAIRDGLLHFALRPGDHLAAPGFDLLQYQPTLLLASLMCGATYLHLTVEQIAKNPELLDVFPLRTLGMDNRLCRTLLDAKKKAGKWERWFRSPAEPLQWQRWDRLIKALNLSEVSGGNLVYQAASGGSILFSLRQKGVVNLEVLPAPGREWRLYDIGLTGKESHGDFGIFGSELEEDKTPLGAMLLCRQERQWGYAGTREPRRCGRALPIAEILSVLEGLPFIISASLFASNAGGQALQSRCILLIFTGFEEELEAKKRQWSEDITAAIDIHLGSEFVPDRIEFYPLYARTGEGIVDHDWCQSQYVTGYLHQKPQLKIYQELTRLRYLACQ